MLMSSLCAVVLEMRSRTTRPHHMCMASPLRRGARKLGVCDFYAPKLTVQDDALAAVQKNPREIFN